MHQDLSVRPRREVVAPHFKLAANFQVIIDLTIEGDQYTPVLICHRLGPTSDVHDAQAPVSEPGPSAANKANSPAIRAAVGERCRQSLKSSRHVKATVSRNRACDPAQGALSPVLCA